MPQRHLTYTPHRKSNFDDSKKYTKFFSHFVLISAARIVYAFIYPALSCIESTILFAFTFFEAMTHALMFNQHTWFVCCRYVFHNFPHTRITSSTKLRGARRRRMLEMEMFYGEKQNSSFRAQRRCHRTPCLRNTYFACKQTRAVHSDFLLWTFVTFYWMPENDSTRPQRR